MCCSNKQFTEFKFLPLVMHTSSCYMRVAVLSLLVDHVLCHLDVLSTLVWPVPNKKMNFHMHYRFKILLSEKHFLCVLAKRTQALCLALPCQENGVLAAILIVWWTCRGLTTNWMPTTALQRYLQERHEAVQYQHWYLGEPCRRSLASRCQTGRTINRKNYKECQEEGKANANIKHHLPAKNATEIANQELGFIVTCESEDRISSTVHDNTTSQRAVYKPEVR